MAALEASTIEHSATTETEQFFIRIISVSSSTAASTRRWPIAKIFERLPNGAA